ncbi:MAG: hypothetical protein GMKNLPBB_00514 [Myxococcota bacterium]|nr:hypothetical protein [Myxococcota bacterium]
MLPEGLPATMAYLLQPVGEITPPSFEPKPLPKIDFHTHIHPYVYELTARFLKEQGIEYAVNLSGGLGGEEFDYMLEFARKAGGRIIPFCMVDWEGLGEDGWSKKAGQKFRACIKKGGRGMKIFKGLGLGVMIPDGKGGEKVLPIDSPLLDPLWTAAGELQVPVAIHTADPKAFWDPPNEKNERYLELFLHPSWSFHDPENPRREELFAARNRVLARHRRTVFAGLHYASHPDNLDDLRALLKENPNLMIDTAARLSEIGRHDPEQVRAFHIEFQDRILFGTDFMVSGRGELTLGSSDESPKSVADARLFFRTHWRFFETRDHNMAHPTPVQGRWTIDGIGLPEPVLRKIYWSNAARLLRIKDTP